MLIFRSEGELNTSVQSKLIRRDRQFHAILLSILALVRKKQTFELEIRIKQTFELGFKKEYDRVD